MKTYVHTMTSMWSFRVFSTIYNSQKGKTAPMFIYRWMNKQVVYLYNGILFNNKKTTNICFIVDEPQKHYKSERSRRQKSQLYTSVYTKCPEKANLEKQKVEMVTDWTWGCEWAQAIFLKKVVFTMVMAPQLNSWKITSLYTENFKTLIHVVLMVSVKGKSEKS